MSVGPLNRLQLSIAVFEFFCLAARFAISVIDLRVPGGDLLGVRTPRTVRHFSHVCAHAYLPIWGLVSEHGGLL